MSVNHKSAKIAIIRKYFYNIMSNSYDVTVVLDKLESIEIYKTLIM
jgi:hypothetical protein